MLYEHKCLMLLVRLMWVWSAVVFRGKVLLELAVRKQLRNGVLNRGEAVVALICVRYFFGGRADFVHVFFSLSWKLAVWTSGSQILGTECPCVTNSWVVPPWILSCPVLHLIQVIWAMQGCSFPAVKVKRLPAQNIEEKIIWDLSLEVLGELAVVVSEPEIYWWRIISLSPLLARCAFVSTLRGLLLKELGTLLISLK